MNDIEITKREVIASISILAIMMIIGIIIGGKLNEYNQDQNAKYNKAFKISKDKDLFAYAMKTNVGNAFAEGEIKAVDTVSNEDIEGEYLIIKKIKEKHLGESSEMDLIIKYLHRDEIKVQDVDMDMHRQLLSLDRNEELYWFMPVIIYILKDILKQH